MSLATKVALVLAHPRGSFSFWGPAIQDSSLRYPCISSSLPFRNMKSPSPQRVLRSLPRSSVNNGKEENAKAPKRSTAPGRPTFTHGPLSSVRKLLLNSRLMLESLENTEELLAAIQPEIFDLCLSPQEGPENVAATPKMAASPHRVY